MRKLILIGSGFHSKIVYEEILKLKKYKVLGYVSNDDKKKHSIRKLKYLGKLEALEIIFVLLRLVKEILGKKYLTKLKNLK